MMLVVLGVVAVAVLAYFAIDRLIVSKLVVADIDRKAVLITGCGGGFGRALAIRCLQNGMTVFAGCRRPESVDELKSLCSGFRGTLHAIQMDVASEDSVSKAKKIVEDKLMESNQQLFGVVNNAGVRGTHMYDDLLTMDDYKSVWETNTFGTIRVTQAFKHLLKKSRGRVIICGSSCTLFTIPSYGPYATSKAAVSIYADVIRNELAPFGVNVSLVIPGSFDSGMQDTNRLLNMLQTKWDSCSETVKEEYGEQFIARAKEFTAEFQSTGISKDVKWVEDTYFHALVSRYPKLLYRIGWDTIVFFHPYSLMPVRVQAAIMRLMLWIVRAPIPAACIPRRT